MRRTLRAQITLVYTVGLTLGLLVFAALSLFILNSTARSSLDQRLIGDARTLRAVLEVRHGRVEIDESDHAQFESIIGVRLSGAVYDADGNVLATSTTPVPREVRSAVSGVGGTPQLKTIGAGVNRVRVAIFPIVDRGRRIGTEVLWRSVDSIAELDERSALIFAVALPVIVLFAVFLGNAIARRSLKRLGLVADMASEIEAHDLSRRLAVPSQPDELGRLCAAFDRMLDRLEAAFERERRFTADASHELRGPLSVIKAEADLALRHERTTAEYRQTLQTVMRESARLESLTSDLLAAARADLKSANGNQHVDIGMAVRNVVDRLSILANARNIHLASNVSAGCVVSAEREAVTRVIFALLHNAVKYSYEGGRVSAAVERNNGTITVRVTDEGTGFSAEAMNNAFDRFWRDKQTNGQDGSGLGLSIAQNIVQRFGGKICVGNRTDRAGAVVTADFPAE